MPAPCSPSCPPTAPWPASGVRSRGSQTMGSQRRMPHPSPCAPPASTTCSSPSRAPLPPPHPRHPTASPRSPARRDDPMTTLTAPTATAGFASGGLVPPPRRMAVFTTFVGRSVLHTLRTPDALVMAIAMPTMLMLLFTQVFGGAIDPAGGYVDYVVPGIILLCAGFGAASTAVDVANDMKAGVIERFRTMPFRAETVIAGHVVASLVRNLVATGIVIGVAVLLGFRPNGSPLEWVAMFALVAGYILAITYLFAAIGLAASNPEAANGYGFFLMFLPYLSSAFVPVETMPE